MWPFKRKDNRPPSDAAKAIAYSLEHEPERWCYGEKHVDILEHDSGIEISTLHGFIWFPRCPAPSESDRLLIISAANKWVAHEVLAPPDDDDDDDDEPEPQVPVVPSRHQLN